jgi:hypothetical protein
VRDINIISEQFPIDASTSVANTQRVNLMVILKVSLVDTFSCHGLNFDLSCWDRHLILLLVDPAPWSWEMKSWARSVSEFFGCLSWILTPLAFSSRRGGLGVNTVAG